MTFPRKIPIHMGNLLNGYVYYSYFTPDFSDKYVSKLLFLALDRKFNKIYLQKLKPGDR